MSPLASSLVWEGCRWQRRGCCCLCRPFSQRPVWYSRRPRQLGRPGDAASEAEWSGLDRLKLRQSGICTGVCMSHTREHLLKKNYEKIKKIGYHAKPKRASATAPLGLGLGLRTGADM